jgi:type IV pilus assembly protein PilA
MLQRQYRQRGQAMTEYIIIVALIAVSAIAVYRSMGHVVRLQTAAMVRELAGESGSAEATQAQEVASATKGQTTKPSLKSFVGNNN